VRRARPVDYLDPAGTSWDVKGVGGTPAAGNTGSCNPDRGRRRNTATREQILSDVDHLCGLAGAGSFTGNPIAIGGATACGVYGFGRAVQAVFF